MWIAAFGYRYKYYVCCYNTRERPKALKKTNYFVLASRKWDEHGACVQNYTGVPAMDWFNDWTTQMKAFGCVEPDTEFCVGKCKETPPEKRCGISPEDLDMDFEQIYASSSCPPCSGGGNSTMPEGDNSTMPVGDNSTLTGAERLLAISVTIAIANVNLEGNKAAVDDCNTPLSTPCQLAQAEMAFFTRCGSPFEAVTEE